MNSKQNKPVPLKRFCRIRFEPNSEVEVILRQTSPKSPSLENGDNQDNCPEIPEQVSTCDSKQKLYLVLLSGSGESFGVQLRPRRLYPVRVGQRFVLQCFAQMELCFLTTESSIQYSTETQDMSLRYPANRERAIWKKGPFVSLNKDILVDREDYSLPENISQSLLNHRSVGSEVSNHRPAELSLHCTEKTFRPRPDSRRLNWSYQSYAHLAKDLNRLRGNSLKSNKTGPNVMVVGPCDSGKSTLAKILINYAIGGGWNPILVDLDVGQGSVGLPGMIGAGAIKSQCLVDEQFAFGSGSPKIIYYGGVTPDSDRPMYEMALTALAKEVFASQLKTTSSTCESNSKNICLKHSGLVINTHGWIQDYGYHCTVEAIRKFHVTHICVLADHRLYERMSVDLRGNKRDPRSTGSGHNPIDISFYPRNFSVIKRPSKLRRTLRLNRIVSYFDSPIPFTTTSIPFDHHPFFRLYSSENFAKFVRGSELRSGKPLTCNVVENNRRKQAIFYHLQRETLLYLMSRVVTILDMSVDRLLASGGERHCLSPKQLLAVKAFGRVTQVDLENNSLDLLLPANLSEQLNSGQLLLLINETSLENV